MLCKLQIKTQFTCYQTFKMAAALSAIRLIQPSPILTGNASLPKRGTSDPEQYRQQEFLEYSIDYDIFVELSEGARHAITNLGTRVRCTSDRYCVQIYSTHLHRYNIFIGPIYTSEVVHKIGHLANQFWT